MYQKIVYLVLYYLFLLDNRAIAEQAVTDTTMSITAVDIEIVRETWKPIAQDLQAAGILILKTFLDKHDYYSNFERFRDHPRETITENPIFKHHSHNVAKAINEAVNLLDQPEKLKDLLTNLGRSHNKKKIRKVQFQNLQIVVLDILRENLNLNPEQQEIWDRVLTLAMSLIFTNLDS